MPGQKQKMVKLWILWSLNKISLCAPLTTDPTVRTHMYCITFPRLTKTHMWSHLLVVKLLTNSHMMITMT